MAKPMSVAEINALRLLLKKATKPAPITPAERSARRSAKLAAYKAEVLAYAIAQWDADAARLRAQHGPRIMVEAGIGLRPTEYSPKLAFRYKRRTSW